MRRTCLFIAVAVTAVAAGPVLAQDDSTTVESSVISGSRIVRQDFESISPATTVTSEQLEFADYVYERELGWREANQQTANRTRAHGSQGASSVRVIRACELSLRLGDEDCAAN